MRNRTPSDSTNGSASKCLTSLSRPTLAVEIGLAIGLCIFGCGKSESEKRPTIRAAPPASSNSSNEIFARFDDPACDLSSGVAWLATPDPPSEKPDLDAVADCQGIPAALRYKLVVSTPPSRFYAMVSNDCAETLRLGGKAGSEQDSNSWTLSAVALESHGRWFAFAPCRDNHGMVRVHSLDGNQAGTDCTLNKDGYSSCLGLAFAGRDTLLAIYQDRLVTCNLKEFKATASRNGCVARKQRSHADDRRSLLCDQPRREVCRTSRSGPASRVRG